MNILESLRVALRGLASNKMRTGLTMLGIIIGVGVVILVVAIGQGATQRVTEAVNSLGTNMLTVMPGESRIRTTAASRTSVNNNPTGTGTGTSGSSGGGGGGWSRLTLEEAKLIATNFPKTVDAVAPSVRGSAQVRLGNVDAKTDLTGTTTEYPYVNNTDVSSGRFFTQDEIDGSMKVCVAGSSVAEKLTGDAGADLTGQTISVNRQDFRVVGMMANKGSGAWGQDQDDVILMPITTAMRRILNRQSVSMISVRCVNPRMMPLAEEQIANFLRSRHHLQPPFPENDDFRIRSQTELMERQQSVTGTMTSLLSAVAIISLVIGGIGIMNIMLVSVTERTREIGIRKAIGATPRDIRMQFLIESSIIALIGGLIGIGLGVGSAQFMSSVAGWTTIVNPASIVVALVVSAGVGIFFGAYPASKAAALHPIEALRYE
jgi:putative ABC transport system permease protein